MHEELSYNCEALSVEVDQFIPMLNNDQKNIFDTVVHAIENQTPALFFIDGPGGSGKTFCTIALLTKVRAEGYHWSCGCLFRYCCSSFEWWTYSTFKIQITHES